MTPMKYSYATLQGFFIFFFVAFCGVGRVTAQETCGTIFSPEPSIPPEIIEQKKREYYLAHPNMAESSSIEILVKPHIIRNSQNEGLSEIQLDAAFRRLNIIYAPIGFVFKFCGEIEYITSDEFYDFNEIEQGQLTSYSATRNNFPNVFNVYFTWRITDRYNNPQGGYSGFPWEGGGRFIILTNGNAIDPSSLAHEFGHSFGLYHTHETMFGKELVVRGGNGNCQTAGDRNCETNADPNLSIQGAVNRDCMYTGNAIGLVDSRGSYYSPDPHNFMSYANSYCRDTFVPSQYRKMLENYWLYWSELECPCYINGGLPNLTFVLDKNFQYYKLEESNNKYKITFTVTNTGHSTSQSCTLGYGLDEDYWRYPWQFRLGSLAIQPLKPCDSITYTIEIDYCNLNTVPSDRLYYLNLFIDENDVITESGTSEDNLISSAFIKNCLPTYIITTVSSPSNYGITSGGGRFSAGEIATVKASPNANSEFVNWTENGTVVSPSANYSFTVQGNRTLVANFSKKRYTVITSSSPTVGGSTIGGNQYEQGAFVTVTATPNTGYSFKNWTENGSIVSSSKNYSFDAVRDRNLVANFERINQYTITTSSYPSSGGTTTGGNTYNANQLVTVNASPESGYTFSRWTENGATVSYSTSYSFNVTGNRNLVAVFTPRSVTYIVNATASPVVGGTTSGSDTYTEGARATISAIPLEGYFFTNWTENGLLFNANAFFTLTVNRSYNLVANFTPISLPRYTLTLSSSPTNGGTTMGSNSYTAGTTVQAKATANTGFTFSRWRNTSGTTISSNNPYSFSINANTELIAEFTSSQSNLVKTGTDSLIIIGTDYISTVTVTNKGLGTSAACKMGYYLSIDGVTKGYKIGTADIPSLSANAQSTIFFKKTYIDNSPEPVITFGNYYVLYSIDDDQTVSETDETDNKGYHSLRFMGDPDCLPVNPFVTEEFQPNSNIVSQAGWIINCSIKTVRLGVETSRNTTLSYYLIGSNGAFYRVGLQNLTLPAGTSSAFNYTFNVCNFSKIPNGTYTLVFVLGSVTPSSLCFRSRGSFTGSLNHPITIQKTACGIILENEPFANLVRNGNSSINQAGSQLNYVAVVMNKGNIPTGACISGYYLKSALTGLEYKLGSRNISALDTGKYSILSFTIDICSQTSIPDGNYHFISKIDDDNIIAESNENDNADTLLNSVIKNCQRTYAINLSANPTNGGTVTGNGVYTEGSSISINATANTGYSFTNWTKNGVVVSTNSSTAITANADQTLIANFVPLLQQYTIAISANPIEAGTTNGGNVYNNGQQATITATATNGWRFAYWSYNGDSITPNSSYSFTVNANKAFVANFVKQYNLTTLANPSTGGSVSGGGTYNANTQTTLSTTPNNGWLFLNWTENNIVRSYTNSFTVAADSPRTYVANYRQKQQYTIGSNVLPSGAGSVAGNGVYTEGGEVTLTATPNAGWYFQNWTENSAVVSTSAAVTVGVLSNRTMTANFTSIPQYTVSISQSPTNAGTISGGGTYMEGTETILRASAKRGYAFRSWTEGSTTVSIDTAYKFINFRNRQLVANFTPITYYYTIATYRNIYIAGTVTGGGIYAENGLVRLVAKPDSGFVFKNWTENGVIVSTDTAYQFTALQNRTLSANFILQAALCINFNPQITVNGSTTLCPVSSPIGLTASGGNMYKWSTNAATANITVSSGGTYQVTITDTLGCNIVLSKTITNGSTPTINVAGNLAFCRGDSTILTASGGSKYKWSTQDTTSSLVVKRGDNYVVTVTNTEGCSATKSIAVTENALPNPQIAGSSTICTGSSTTLTATGGVSYRWSNNATTASITISQAGTYSVTVTDANGCKAITSKILTLGTTLSPNITGDSSICQGSTAVLTTSGGTSYLWSNGSTTPSITVSQSGSYAVTVTNGSGCNGSTSRNVVVNPLPTPIITGLLSFCANNSTTLTATGGTSYLWSTGATTASIIVTTASSLTVTVTDAKNCKASITKNTIVNALPKDTISVTPSTTICDGKVATINVRGGDSYLWSTGQTTPTISVTESGTYYVTVSNMSNCRKIDSIKIERINRPIANFSFTQVGGQVTFLNNSFGTTFNWNFGNGVTSSLPNPVAIYTANGTYTVRLIVGNVYGCFDTINKTIQITRVATNEFLEKMDVDVSPNPFNTQLNVRFSTPLDFGKADYLFITNILGQEIYRQSINSQESFIDTGNWNYGVYSLNINYKRRTRVLKKVVKIK